MKISKTLLLAAVAGAFAWGSEAQAALKFTDYFQGGDITGTESNLPGVAPTGAFEATTVQSDPTMTVSTAVNGITGFQDLSVLNDGTQAPGAQSASATINIENNVYTWWKGVPNPPVNGFSAVDFTGNFRNNGAGDVTFLVEWGGSFISRTLGTFGTASLDKERLYWSPSDKADYTGTSAPLRITISGADTFSGTVSSITLTSNPEPASIGLLGGVFAAMGGTLFRRRRKLADVAAA